MIIIIIIKTILPTETETLLKMLVYLPLYILRTIEWYHIRVIRVILFFKRHEMIYRELHKVFNF